MAEAIANHKHIPLVGVTMSSKNRGVDVAVSQALGIEFLRATAADTAVAALLALESMVAGLCLALGQWVKGTAHITDSKARTEAWGQFTDEVFRKLAEAGWPANTRKHTTAKQYLATLNGIRKSVKPEVVAIVATWAGSDTVAGRYDKGSFDVAADTAKGTASKSDKEKAARSLEKVRADVAALSDSDKVVIAASIMTTEAIRAYILASDNAAECAIIAETAARHVEALRAKQEAASKAA